MLYLKSGILVLLCVIQGTEERNHDLVQAYKTYFEHHVNPTNLALFIDSYIRRTDLNIVRELEPSKRKNSQTLSMPVMNITGALSPHVEDTVTLNGRLDPTNSTWMKVRCGDYFEVHCSCGDTSLFISYTSILCFLDVIYSMKTAHVAKISKAKSVAVQAQVYCPCACLTYLMPHFSIEVKK